MLLDQLAYSRLFWDRYEWRVEDDFAYEALEDQPTVMKLTEQYSVWLDPGEDLGYISFGLQETGKEAIELAWDDQGHFHPYILRYGEWCAIAKRVALVHQVPAWIPGLLLRRFVGIDPGKEEERLEVQQQELEWRRLSGLFAEEELKQVMHITSRPISEWASSVPDRKWQFREPYGWIMEGEDAYSLRQPANAGFPFAEWNQMIAALSE